MSWQTVLDVIDAIESWVAGQSYWIQVVLLLAVLGPLCYLLAGLIDRAVEAVLAWHGRRDQPVGPSASAAGARAGSMTAQGAGSSADGAVVQGFRADEMASDGSPGDLSGRQAPAGPMRADR